LQSVKQAYAASQVLMDSLNNDPSGQAFEQLKVPVLSKLSESMGVEIDPANATPESIEELNANALVDLRSMMSPQEAEAFTGFGQPPETPVSSRQSDLMKLQEIEEVYGKNSPQAIRARSVLVSQTPTQREYGDYLLQETSAAPMSMMEFAAMSKREQAAATTEGREGVLKEFANMKTLDQNVSAIESSYNVTSLINSAIEGSNAWNTGLGSYLSFIRGSGARDLESQILTIKGNIGFDRLQRMRSESPTGGALGSIAVQELNALQSTIANLDTTQSEEQLDQNLRAVLMQYGRWQEAWGKAIMKEGTREQKERYYNAVPPGEIFFTYDEASDDFIRRRKSGE